MVTPYKPMSFPMSYRQRDMPAAVGALLLSTELAGKLYQHRGEAHGDPKGTCYGADCFR